MNYVKSLSVPLVLSLLAAGPRATGDSHKTPKPASATDQAQQTARAAAPVAKEIYAPVIDPANFVMGVENPFFPLLPGTTFVYEGKTGKGIEHNEVTVLPETKIIMGVTCVVVHDTVRVGGKLAEATFDWYAQDKQGNVWYFGEDSKEYKHGKAVSTHGSWEAGVNGAQPGLMMKANSRVGDAYRQEYYKGKAEDMAAVLGLNESAVVPYGNFGKLLMIKEWSALDPAPDVEHKYYSRDTGLVMTRAIGGGNWVLPLVEIRRTAPPR